MLWNIAWIATVVRRKAGDRARISRSIPCARRDRRRAAIPTRRMSTPRRATIRRAASSTCRLMYVRRAPFAVSAERDVEIIAQPLRQRDVPPAPEFCDRRCEVRHVEVFGQVEADDPRHSDRDVGVSRKIAVDLERVRNDGRSNRELRVCLRRAKTGLTRVASRSATKSFFVTPSRISCIPTTAVRATARAFRSSAEGTPKRARLDLRPARGNTRRTSRIATCCGTPESLDDRRRSCNSAS